MPHPVAEACAALLDDYRRAPLTWLREVNLQSRLQHQVRAALHAHALPVTAVATLAGQAAAPGYGAPATFVTERVQLEMKVGGAQKTDLVVFGDGLATPVALTRTKWGALDILATVAATHVDALVEIKAAPSAYAPNAEAFRADVLKLLRAQRARPGAAYPLGAHLVCVDKSLGLGGFVAPGRYGVGDEWLGVDALAAAGLTVAVVPPAAGRHVTVWRLPADPAAPVATACRFVSAA